MHKFFQRIRSNTAILRLLHWYLILLFQRASWSVIVVSLKHCSIRFLSAKCTWISSSFPYIISFILCRIEKTQNPLIEDSIYSEMIPALHPSSFAPPPPFPTHFAQLPFIRPISPNLRYVMDSRKLRYIWGEIELTWEHLHILRYLHKIKRSNCKKISLTMLTNRSHFNASNSYHLQKIEDIQSNK